MKRLLTEAAAVEDRFQARMYATGGKKLIRRPDRDAFSKKHNKRPSSQNKDVYAKDEIKDVQPVKKPANAINLVNLYKQCCLKLLQKIHPAVVFPLKYNRELALDMDSL